MCNIDSQWRGYVIHANFLSYAAQGNKINLQETRFKNTKMTLKTSPANDDKYLLVSPGVLRHCC